MADLMSELVRITLVEGPSTPARYRNRVGEMTPPFDPNVQFIPAAGWEGQVVGVPGIMRDNLEFEIADVDLRTNVEKLLDAAAKLLHQPPEDDLDEMRLRHLQAENLMLTAKLEMLRRGQ